MNRIYKVVFYALMALVGGLTALFVYVSLSLALYGEDIMSTGRGLDLRAATTWPQKLLILIRPWFDLAFPIEWRPTLLNILDGHYLLFGGEMWALFLFRWVMLFAALALGLKILCMMGAELSTRLFLLVPVLLCPLPIIVLSTSTEVFLLLPMMGFLWWIYKLGPVTKLFSAAPMHRSQMLSIAAVFVLLTGLKETAIPLALLLVLVLWLLHHRNGVSWFLLAFAGAWFAFALALVLGKGVSTSRGVDIFNFTIWAERLKAGYYLLFPLKPVKGIDVFLMLFFVVSGVLVLRNWLRRRVPLDFLGGVFLFFIATFVVSVVPMSKYGLAERYLIPAYFLFYFLIAAFFVRWQKRPGLRWVPIVWAIYFGLLSLNRSAGQYATFARYTADEAELYRRLTDLGHEGCPMTMSGKTWEKEGAWGQMTVFQRILGPEGQAYFGLRDWGPRRVLVEQSSPSDLFPQAQDQCLALVSSYSPLNLDLLPMLPAEFKVRSVEAFGGDHQGLLQSLVEFGLKISAYMGHRILVYTDGPPRLYLYVLARGPGPQVPQREFRLRRKGRYDLKASQPPGRNWLQLRVSASARSVAQDLILLDAEGQRIDVAAIVQDEGAVTYVTDARLAAIEVREDLPADLKVEVALVAVKASTRRFGALLR